MDIDRIKALYDERFKGNPRAMEDYVISRLDEEAFKPKRSRVAVPSGYRVIFEYDEDGFITDMRFERKH